jgi:transposase
MQVTQTSVEVVSTDPEIVARVAAVDVGKNAGVVCVRTPRESRPGQRATRVWTVPARTAAITGLAGQLIELGIERIVLEATSDYWRPFFYLLEARGLTVWLVNARDVKNVPGRPKTDKLDAVWLAKLNERGMLHASFVPPVQIRQLRDYTRLRSDLIADRTRQAQRVEKLLEDALIKLSSGGDQHHGRVRPGHARRVDRRRTGFAGTRRDGEGAVTDQTRGVGRRSDRPIR